MGRSLLYRLSVWQSEMKSREDQAKLLRGLGHIVIFVLGTVAVGLGIFTHDLGLIAAGTTLFGVVGIARA